MFIKKMMLVGMDIILTDHPATMVKLKETTTGMASMLTGLRAIMETITVNRRINQKAIMEITTANTRKEQRVIMDTIMDKQKIMAEVVHQKYPDRIMETPEEITVLLKIVLPKAW